MKIVVATASAVIATIIISFNQNLHDYYYNYYYYYYYYCYYHYYCSSCCCCFCCCYYYYYYYDYSCYTAHSNNYFRHWTVKLVATML